MAVHARSCCYTPAYSKCVKKIKEGIINVVGDARRYSWVITLRVVETFDFMTRPMGASTV